MIGTTPTHPHTEIPEDTREIILNTIQAYWEYKLLDNRELSKAEALKMLLDVYRLPLS